MLPLAGKELISNLPFINHGIRELRKHSSFSASWLLLSSADNLYKNIFICLITFTKSSEPNLHLWTYATEYFPH